MNQTSLLILSFVIGFILFTYLLDLRKEYLNLSCLTPELPTEFKDIYEKEKYKTSQDYLKTNTKFQSIQSTLMIFLTIPFILLGGFNILDIWARSLELSNIPTGLIYFGSLILLSTLIGIPFNIYHTFVIEENYGFNKTTPKTFILDIIKSLLLSSIILGILGYGILWFFENFSTSAWLLAWLFTTILQMLMVFIGPSLIMPLFNKFEPLEESELKTKIEAYASKESFFLKGLMKMDGSKRSSKANAFFTGFFKTRRVVLFDTLIKNHSSDELVAIVAHEIGHYKKKHILKSILKSIILSGIMFYILSLFLNNPYIFTAFKMENLSIYVSLILFGFLYSPIQTLTGIISNKLSRSHEFEADHFAATTTNNPESLIDALKKLSIENMSNLTPHPFKVSLDYSHPPILERINAIKAIQT